MNIVIVIQARRGSTRLPDKVLLPLAGQPLLLRMYDRVATSKLASLAVVATTTNKEDNVIEDLCRTNGIPVYRGDERDLLDRHYQTARTFAADVCVKIPSDCPLIDPRVIDRVLAFYITNRHQYDFVSNLHPATYPDGQDVEVMSMAALTAAWREAKTPMQREHTTPFIWDQPDRFRIGNVQWEQDRDYSLSHRWTIDYFEDYEFINTIYNELHREGAPAFGVDDVLELLQRRPDIQDINKQYVGVNWYRNHLSELRTVNASMTKQLERL